MKIAENIEALQLRMNFTGEESVIHPVLLWDSGGPRWSTPGCRDNWRS